MPYKLFKKNNPGCNAIRAEIRKIMNEFLEMGEKGRSYIETVYEKAFPGKTSPDAKAMVDEIMRNHQSQSGELRNELRKMAEQAKQT